MKTVYQLFLFFVVSLCFVAAPCIAGEISLSSPIQMTSSLDVHDQLLYAENSEDTGAAAEEEEDLDYLDDEELDEIADPFESLNRIAFKFNDKLYFWFLKPVAKGYSWLVPEAFRISIRNFFNNIATPVRVVNNALQFKMKSAGKEVVRFGFNSTFGVLGLFDYAGDNMDIKMQDEDLGQTFGVWGAGPGFYITWPLLGPSSLRDTIGDIGDTFLDPVSYVTPTIDRLAIKAGDGLNSISLRLGDYEDIKKDAIDPYDAFKDIYHQYRKSKIDK